MISIIIPVYQCENIISDIIEDILKQTYQDYEVLLIDDGSTDGSAKVCQEYGQKDARIRTILNMHQGVSGTRNTGIALANGEYIAFIDSDDRIEPDYFEQLYNNIGNNDLVISTFDRWFYNHKDIVKVVKNIQLNAEINMKENFAEYFSELYVSTLLGVVYCKLFRTDVIKKNEMRFRNDIYIGEDYIFNFDYMKKCDYVRCIPYMGYHYVCKKGNSLTQKKDLRKFEYGKVLFEESIKFVNEMGVSAKKAKGVYNLYLRTVLKNIEVIYQMIPKMSRKDKSDYIKKVIEDQSVEETLKKAEPDNNEFKIYKKVLNTKKPFIIGSFAKLRLYYKKIIRRA